MTQDENDVDPLETQEWLDALESVLEVEGPERAHHLIESLVEKARRSGAYLPYKAETAYQNTIPAGLETPYPGDMTLEREIRAVMRWNAMAMVVRANKKFEGLGGHIASYASSATLYEVGLNHCFRAPSAEHDGDLVFFQGHSSPGIYARAYLEGRITEAQLDHFRREARPGVPGLSSYPHPWLMPDFWQFPTVSMGLGPLMAIYQARFMRYLEDRGIKKTEGRRVWAFMGDGEMDEPESLGAISLAAREELDNLTFVVNCNLQRLDGPVRGNSSIIQELEAVFRGAGWNVIKVIWGSYWDPLIARDRTGLLRKRMDEAVDGEYQAYKASLDGGYVRKHFFGKYPELLQAVSHLTDADVWRLNRGGHDPAKIYAAYAAAMAHKGQPTVILAKTVKGYGMGTAGEAMNITHGQKKVGEDILKSVRDRWNIPISDADVGSAPFYRPPEDSEIIQYLRARREALGGVLPIRRCTAPSLPTPPQSDFQRLLESSGDRELSTTMAYVRILGVLLRDKELGKRIVPIVSDEARTFGMEGLFRQIGIYSHIGQLYTPVDADGLAPYKEATDGQMLQEGITEAGALGSWAAAGASYMTHGLQMIPFFAFYSMFGFQRIGDMIWASADMQARGFLIGATSGRTTLNGEGLQHQDGHSHLMAATVPNCVAYDPTWAYELAIIIREGLRRMVEQQENVFYYITTMNENYLMPAMPEGAEEGILRGMHRIRSSGIDGPRVQLLGCGTILRESLAAAEYLEKELGVGADVWSVTSFNELRRDGISCERHNRLHPLADPKVPWVARKLAEAPPGPVIATTDYMRAYADQVRAWVDRRYVVLGTDGFGRSDTRENLRAFFEVNWEHVVVAALGALADDGVLERAVVAQAIGRLSLDPNSPDPWSV